jgi:hypothetical protein
MHFRTPSPQLGRSKSAIFFQNNNTVLVPLTSYVRDSIFSPTSASASSTVPPTHFVDAYCGAGIFALVLAPHFTQERNLEDGLVDMIQRRVKRLVWVCQVGRWAGSRP